MEWNTTRRKIVGAVWRLDGSSDVGSIIYLLSTGVWRFESLECGTPNSIETEDRSRAPLSDRYLVTLPIDSLNVRILRVVLLQSEPKKISKYSIEVLLETIAQFPGRIDSAIIAPEVGGRKTTGTKPYSPTVRDSA